MRPLSLDVYVQIFHSEKQQRLWKEKADATSRAELLDSFNPQGGCIHEYRVFVKEAACEFKQGGIQLDPEIQGTSSCDAWQKKNCLVFLTIYLN